MSTETIMLPVSLDGDYGIKTDAMVAVRFSVTPADVAPRNQYGQPEHPDSPEAIEIIDVKMRLGLGDSFRELSTFDHDAIVDALIEARAESKQREADYAAEIKGE